MDKMLKRFLNENSEGLFESKKCEDLKNGDKRSCCFVASVGVKTEARNGESRHLMRNILFNLV